MGISSNEFLQYVIQPTLRQLGVQSNSAEQLLLATAHHQSGLGKHLQFNNGIGVYGITERQHIDVWDHYLALDADLASQVRGMASQHEFPKAPHLELATNLSYATAIAWMIYRSRKFYLPESFTAQDLSKCWRECFLERPACDKDTAEFVCGYQALVHSALVQDEITQGTATTSLAA
ncbi:MAG TPA: hypothetical protein VM553_09485 [Dongiaceae bacterium]|nr:hypothetical protein [Dongiaceae bacterium]